MPNFFSLKTLLSDDFRLFLYFFLTKNQVFSNKFNEHLFFFYFFKNLTL